MRIHIESFGTASGSDRPPIVLLHGAPTHPGHLRPLAEHLAAAWSPYLVHLPNYGKSESLVPYDLEESHRRLEAALLKEGIEEAHFVGHSGGAYRSFALAIRGRVRARSVMALGASVNFEPEESAGLRAYAGMLRDGIDPVPILLDLMLSPRGRTNATAVADVRQWASATSREDLARELEAFAAAPDLRAGIAQLSVPVTLCVGALDQSTPPARSHRIRAVAENARVVELADVGHAMLVEDFPTVSGVIEEHLASAGRGPSTRS